MKVDVSKLAPPSEMFMLGMQFLRKMSEKHGRYSFEAGVAMGMVLDYAPAEITDAMRSDAKALGLTPRSMQIDEHGEPVFTNQDLGAFYVMDPAAVRAAMEKAMEAASPGCL